MLICFIVCHLGSANQIADYQPVLESQGYEVRLYATGSISGELQKRQVKVIEFNPGNLNLQQMGEEQGQLAQQIAKTCSIADVIITDVGHPFTVQIHLALNEYQKLHLAYYDNPDNWVGGGYSKVAAQVIRAAKGVIFANSHLIQEGIEEEPGKPIDLENKLCWGTGYYPLDKAKEIQQARLDSERRQEIRRKFFDAYAGQLTDKGQKILVYMGGNNDIYFDQALPALGSILNQAAQQKEFSDYIVVVQQHGGAKARNEEVKHLPIESQNPSFTCVLSKLTTDEVQILADEVLYYQTSLIYQTRLAGIPVMQIGHDTFNDRLIKKSLCKSVTTAKSFLKELSPLLNSSFDEETSHQVQEAVGYDKNWKKRLKDIFGI